MRTPILIEGLILGVSFVLHELGHIRRMQALKMFKGLKWHWWGLECLVDQDADGDISYLQMMGLYLAGFGWGMIPLPLWVLVGSPPAFFIMLAFVCSMFDFQGCIKLTSKILKRKIMNLRDG